jgi:hypothetical protein
MPGLYRLSKPENLSEELAEYRYYDTHGKQFIAQHWKMVPLLVGAHLVRSVLPNPTDGAHTYDFWVFRCLLYVATFVAIRQRSLRLDSWFDLLFVCSVLMTLLTVLMYSGDGRYLYPQNILLLVLVCSTQYKKLAVFHKLRNSLRMANRTPMANQASGD